MAEPAKIRVVVVDDHPILRAGLQAKIDGQPDMVVVGEAEDGPGAVAAFARHLPDVMLLDLRLPVMDAPEVISAIVQGHRDARIIVLSTYDTEEDVFRVLRAGARGYVLKGTFVEGILEAIRSVHAGQHLLAPALASRLAARVGGSDVSGREIRVLELVAKGLRNKEIASALGVSENTVKFYLKRIFLKLGVEDRMEAVLVASQRGVIRLS